MRNSRNPTGQEPHGAGYLYKQVGKLRSLHRAWTTVRASAQDSKDPEIRNRAKEIDAELPKVFRTLQRSLGKQSFEFQAQKGVLKKRPGKTPRPIIVAPLINRIVQRAILDVCQSEEPGVRKRLGALPALIETETSVGGRGVPAAIALIQRAIHEGATWYVRSDIVDFFTKVPKAHVCAFLEANVGDPAFVRLFMSALETELCNPDEVRNMLHAFPLDEVGVPQGSSLSALCGNIVLQGFDRQLNGRGITTPRYLDDFVILGQSKRAVEKAWQSATATLAELGMSLHDPFDPGSKASCGLISEGFDFLSFHISDSHVAPSRSAKQEFLNDLAEVINKAKRSIIQGGEGRRAEERFAQTLVLLDRKIRGWGDAFQATTQRLVFHQLDKEIDLLTAGFMSWFAARTASLPSAIRRRMLGVAMLSDTPDAREHAPPSNLSAARAA